MISIRPARFQEISIISEFQVNLAAETENILLDKDLVSVGIEALFIDPAKGVYYIAEEEGTAVGCFLITYEWSDWRNGMVWWLQSVYVQERHRRKGVFRRMYAYLVETISKDPEVIGLRLYVDKSNRRAQEVYGSLGMNGDHYTVFEWMKR
jgi:GNAT superfamily N-acetyltransferase